MKRFGQIWIKSAFSGRTLFNHFHQIKMIWILFRYIRIHVMKIPWAPVELAKSLPQLTNFSPAANHFFYLLFFLSFWWDHVCSCYLSHVLWTHLHLDILVLLIELLARLPFGLMHCTRPLSWQGAEPGGSSYEKLWPFFCGAIKWGCLGPWLWIINSSPQ